MTREEAVAESQALMAIDAYSKTLRSVNLGNLPSEEKDLVVAINRETLLGLIREVRLLRFLRERPDQASQGL